MSGFGMSPNARAPNIWKVDVDKHHQMASSILASSRGLRADSYNMDKETRRLQKQSQTEVECALADKMEKSAQVKSSLKHALASANDALAMLGKDRGQLEGMYNSKRGSLELATNRYTMRSSRPVREHTSDTVQNLLCKQQGELNKNIKAINSLIAENDNCFKKLTSLRMALEQDMRDKSHALTLDSKALQLDGSRNVNLAHSIGSVNVPFRANNWARKSGVLTKETQEAVNEAGRLHRRVLKADKDLANEEAHIMGDVQKALKAKMGETLSAATALDRKLKSGHKEIDSALKTRDSLSSALDSKSTPLTLVQQRYHTRHSSRPSREAVHDDVEVALSTEYTELNGIVKELNKKHKKVNMHIKQLNINTNMLQMNLSDKSSAYDVDATVYRMAHKQ